MTPPLPTIAILDDTKQPRLINLADYDPARDLSLEEFEAAHRVLAGQTVRQLRDLARELSQSLDPAPIIPRGAKREELVFAICKARKERS